MSLRATTFLLLALLASAAPGLAAEGPEMLSDSTRVESWTLDNGLRVRIRDVPRSNGVSVTVGYRVGSDQDPADREGLAQLLGLLGFTAPAGDVPERTVEEMDSQRPLGWSFPVSRRFTLFTEVATVKQFPGVLSQMAARMRGVRVTPEALRKAVKQVQREMGEQLFGAPDQSLYFQAREVALGHTDEALLRRASAKSLETLGLRDVQEQLRRLYVPANAVLSIAGNLDGIDVHRLVDGLFADIPAGVSQPDTPTPGLHAGSRIVMRAQLPGPMGVLGVVAPAIDDTLHPSFYLTALLVGTHLGRLWSGPAGQAAMRHQYAVMDEPELVRFYPPMGPKDTGTDALGQRMTEAIDDLKSKLVPSDTWRELRARTAWQLGGAMPPQVLETVRSSPFLLHNLSRSAAGRVLFGGDAFWEQYRRRFETQPSSAGRWYEWLTDKDKQVRLVYAPRR